MKSKNIILVFAGIFGFGAALFQAAIGFVPEWSAHFGAPAGLLSNPPLLLAAALAVALLLSVIGFYGLSGAGIIRRLPLLRLGLFVIGGFFLFMSIPVVPQLLAILNSEPYAPPVFWVSLYCLVTGLLYWLGLAAGWKVMKPKVAAAGA